MPGTVLAATVSGTTVFLIDTITRQVVAMFTRDEAAELHRVLGQVLDVTDSDS